MEENHVNMYDVRCVLGVKSVAWKIEKRVLERIGHVLRMGNERVTKAAVLGWYEGLEGMSKVRGRKRKTVLYWKRMLREAGVDWTDVERMSGDRDGWKKMIGVRMEHLDVWERQKGHQYEWSADEVGLERNVRAGMNEWRCRFEGCERVCKSKAGLVSHERRHRLAEERVRFVCERCDGVFETEVARVNHGRTCAGGGRGRGVRECGNCGSWVSRRSCLMYSIRQ